ncbi:MAG: hypothetical protein V1492_00330 [Candidatus Micrarchaeota archaeon]
MGSAVESLKPAPETKLDNFQARAKAMIRDENRVLAEGEVQARLQTNSNDIDAINVLLKIHSEMGRKEKAETLFKEIMRKHISNQETFSTMLEYCSLNCTVGKTKQFFDLMVARGIADEKSHRLMLRTYGNEGAIDRMWELFKEMRQHGPLSMRAYHEVFDYLLAGREHNDKAMQAFRWLVDMRAECDSPADMRYVEKTCGLLVVRLVKNNQFEEALHFLETNKECAADPRAYTVLVNEFANRDRIDEMISLGDKLASAGRCDTILFTVLLKRCALTGRLDAAEKFYNLAISGQKTCDAYTFGTMIEAYHSSGNFAKARKVFDEAERRGCANVPVHNSMIIHYKNAGMMDAAQEIFDRALANGIIDFTLFDTLARSYLVANQSQKAAQVFSAILGNGMFEKITEPKSLVAIFRTYHLLGDTKMLEILFSSVKSRGLHSAGLYGVMIKTYLSGELTGEKVKRAADFFEEAAAESKVDSQLVMKMLVAYRAMNDWENMLNIFIIAEKNNIISENSCSYMLDTLCEFGNVELARQFFANVPEEHKKIGVYNTLLKVYIKAGRLDEARRLYDGIMKKDGFADEITYSTMLSSYQNAAELKYAEKIFEAAKAAKKADPFVYLTMASIYYSRRMHQAVEKLIDGADESIRNDTQVKLLRFEALRKQAKYKQVLEEINSFIAGYPDKGYSDDNYVLALVIRAFCINHGVDPSDAFAEFSVLKVNCPEDSVHYARILCGYVFSAADAGLLQHIDKQKIRVQLESFRKTASNGIAHDITGALQILEGNGRIC